MKKVWDPRWEKFYRQSNGNAYPEVSVVRFVAQNYYGVPARAKVKILDLGCGTGAHQWYLAREGFSVYGIDASAMAIAKAKKRLRKEGLRSALRVGDFLKLPYKDGSMDAVIDAASIQHNSNDAIKKILKEVRRVLKHEGKFFSIPISQHKNMSDKRFKTHFFKKGEIRDFFSNFKNVKIDHMLYTQGNGKDFIKFLLVEAGRP